MPIPHSKQDGRYDSSFPNGSGRRTDLARLHLHTRSDLATTLSVASASIQTVYRTLSHAGRTRKGKTSGTGGSARHPACWRPPQIVPIQARPNLAISDA